MITLAPIFQSHMVIQANKPIYIFGVAEENTPVVICLLGRIYNYVLQKGKFLFKLPEIPIISIPFSISITSKTQEIIIEDCLAGDVFLCAGQSNMQYVCKDVINIEYKEFKQLRFYEVPKIPYNGAENEFDWLYSNSPKWVKANPITESDFSAIGYLIGKNIVQKHNIPIGIISCNMGDTTIYSWINFRYIETNKILRPYLDDYLKWKDIYKDYESYSRYFNKQLPLLMDFYSLLDKYRKEGYSSEEVYKFACQKIPNPYLPMGPKNQNRPSGCYDTMLKTIIPYSNNGIIYYQGENDVSRADEYKEAINLLIQCWRDAFMDDQIFINCQIAGHIYSNTSGYDVAKLRDAQISILNIGKKQYVVSVVDYGEKYNIHPVNKIPVARRISNVIEEFIYKAYNNSLSPVYDSHYLKDNILFIKTINNNMNLVKKNVSDTGFWALTNNGDIKKITEMDILNNMIVIPEINDYIEIRYGYTDFPSLSIYTENDLPLLPFKFTI